MKSQLVGLPLATHRRLQKELQGWASSLKPAHEVRFVPSKDEHRPIVQLQEIKDVAASVNNGYVHILVVPTRHFSLLLSEFQFDCRISSVQLPGGFKSLQWPTLRSALETCLDFENRWVTRIGPSDLRHPLLLPPPSFHTHSSVGDFWRACDVYGETQRIAAAHDVLQKVCSRHQRRESGIGQYWVDCSNRRFHHDRAAHGLTPEERTGTKRFRFCFPVPQGFHFDVTHELGNHFLISDCHGITHKLLRANVDPWGRIR